ncbi:DUF488 family protein [Specibacter cremeus]|uniref:DUF488 domain-containing protein n=1 Tax=Specibacter cremeus TaxID=1629051 RepID=UPI000F78DA79|nr:DUF488 domain-containing protein [Specibacter cremeus]
MADITIYTVGHSTHPIDDFIELLKAHGIKKLIDIRTIPKSRHNPQFMEEAVATSVRARGITYRRMEALGGLRHVRKDSPNGAWHNASFQGYADYMQTPDFAEAVDKLIHWGRHSDAAIMCAEAVPWRCHRSLIGDALLVRGVTVLDIMTAKSATPHTLTSFAHVEGTTITYPPGD